MKAECFLRRSVRINFETALKASISVLMPVYETSNFEDFERSIHSVLVQSFHDFELIIVDDGSDPRVESIVRSIVSSDARVRYVRYAENCGLPAIRANEGVLLAGSAFLAFALNNDVWHPEMLGSLHQQLAPHPDLDAVYGNLRYYVEGDVGYELLNEKYGDAEFSPRSIRVANYIPCNAFLIRKQSFLSVGLFNPHILMRRISDWDFWIRASAQLKIKHVPVHCGEMFEPRKNSLSRRCRIDIDLLRRFSNFMNWDEAPIRTLEDLSAYELDRLPLSLPKAFSAWDIAACLRELELYYEQEKMPFRFDEMLVSNSNRDIPLRVGIFEMDGSVDPSLLKQISEFASYGFLASDTPLSECLKNNVILYQGLNEQELNTGFHKALRSLLHCYCVAKPEVPQTFNQVVFIDPIEGSNAVEKALRRCQKESQPVVMADLKKQHEAARILEDTFNHVKAYSGKEDFNNPSFRAFVETLRRLWK